MATYDAAAGTGGLDGSIAVEAFRPEVSLYDYFTPTNLRFI
jgi:hypothetical protein